VDLWNGDTESVADLVAQVARDRGRVALVVVDTLARSMTGNENSPEDMGKYVASCARIRGAAETHVLVVHHSGKDLARGARGHSSLRAASDTELEVTRGEGGSCLAITKNRDEEDRARFGFRLEPVELGVNAKGRTVTTCVAIETEVVGQAKKVPLTPGQRTVLDCLATAIADHGQDAPPAHDIPRKVRVVQLAKWCEAALRYLPGDKGVWRKRQDFDRIAQALQGKYLVRHVDGWCWPTAAAEPSLSSATTTTRTHHNVENVVPASRPRTTTSTTHTMSVVEVVGGGGPGWEEKGAPPAACGMPPTAAADWEDL
jgi:hypothetical protein